MKTQLDIRSMLIGILLTICCIFALGAARSTNPALNARFQLVCPGEGSNAFVIDTSTGQVWAKYSGNRNTNNFLTPKIGNTVTEENN